MEGGGGGGGGGGGEVKKPRLNPPVADCESGVEGLELTTMLGFFTLKLLFLFQMAVVDPLGELGAG